jgi:hypothetical protein
MALAITTRSYDNARTGTTLDEQALTPASVGTRGIRRAFSLQLTGDRRGIEAQPLAVEDVQLADGSRHDVIYLADMANQIWAFDAATGQQLWTRLLASPVNGDTTIDRWNINDHWGVLGTPVIDVDAGVMYVVTWSSPGGHPADATHSCHAVRLADGGDAHPAIDLEGAVYDAGHGTQIQRFRSATRKQRAALLLTKVAGVSTVFIGFGTVNETSQDARGWILACATQPLALTAAWCSTAAGFGGGIWHGGGGLAADTAGLIYAMTGNGSFNGTTDFAESFVKLRYTPPAVGADRGTLTLVDWWTPFTDKVRIAAAPPTTVADVIDGSGSASAPGETPVATNFRAYAAGARARAQAAGLPVRTVEELASAPLGELETTTFAAAHGSLTDAPADAAPAMAMDEWGDMDLASGGPVLIASHHAVLGAGKDGISYVVNQDQMGRTAPSDLINPAQNYQRLLSPPIFFTYFPPPLSPAPDDFRTLNVLWAGQTHHLHGNAVYWDSPDHGPVVFCWGENGNLRAWSLGQDASLKYLACSAEVASAQSPVPPGGMPGGMISVSADQDTAKTGIVWAAVPYADANQQISNGRLLAYDASTFGTFGDGSGQLRVLWDSQDWNLPFLFNKFNRPVVFKGRVYVPTYEDRVDVYELA